MKLQFDSNQDYQIAAMRAALELFRGQPPGTGSAQSMLAASDAGALPGIEQDLIAGNRLLLGDDVVLENLRRVQAAHGIGMAEMLESPDFSVEMETGTGKTYVYLRTLYELHREYGFNKFVIVVPSIAIKEGVLKNLEITKEHFDLLYGHPGMDFEVYDPKNRGQARTFARSQSPRILVINIDSFAKFAREEEEAERRTANIIYQNSDWGVPMHYIQGVRPIVVVDEPQNMETPIRRQALANLKPLFTLRYSATHRNSYNLIYRLDPVRAYDLGLVKKIEVDSAVVENAHNDAFVEVVAVKSTASSVTVSLRIDVNTDGGVERKTVSIRRGARKTGEGDLYVLSGGRDAYRNGFILDAVNVERQAVTFSSGLTLRAGERHGGMTDAIMRQQIEDTVRLHFEKERRLQKMGVKVLSLFFIDRVANYRAPGPASGQTTKGKFAVWFEEAFAKIAAEPGNAGLIPHSAEAVHNGYFSQDRNGVPKDTGGETKDDDDTYTLIMRDKERLLSQEEPLRFIFSHSALREGWDNPNVFQICTLNEARSDIRKRQEIGRGLRLPVDQDGRRVFDSSINILTVFANESFADFAKALQREIQDDCGVEFKGRIKDRRKRITAKPQEKALADHEFRELWRRVSVGTRYRVDFDSDTLVREAAKCVAAINVQEVVVVSTRYGVSISLNEGVGGAVKDIQTRRQSIAPEWIPDILGHIQARTRLTRHTIWRILQESGRIGDILKNPQQFIDSAAEAIETVMLKLLVDGVKYEKVAAPVAEWDMRRFASEELDAYLDTLVKVEQPEKTVYEYVPIDGDSGVERKFARDLDSLFNIKFYMKLPRWFKIPTPLGDYIPDWAVVFEGDKRLYFVAETKSKDQELRPSESMKIACARKHFAATGSSYDDLRYAAPVTEVKEMAVQYGSVAEAVTPVP